MADTKHVSDMELVVGLRQRGEHAAAERIEALIKERDDALDVLTPLGLCNQCAYDRDLSDCGDDECKSCAQNCVCRECYCGSNYKYAGAEQ